MSAEPDRYSSVLGHPVAVMQPLGTPKPREACVPFSFELYPAGDPSALKGQEAVIKGLERLAQAQDERAPGRLPAPEVRTAMRSVEEQRIETLAKARGITLDEARAQLAAAKSVAVKNPKGH